MMDEHWRSVVHPDRVQGILAFTEGSRNPSFRILTFNVQLRGEAAQSNHKIEF